MNSSDVFVISTNIWVVGCLLKTDTEPTGFLVMAAIWLFFAIIVHIAERRAL